jgi:hypothetical protein
VDEFTLINGARTGSLFPDPAGRCCAGPKGGGSSMTWSFTSTVVAKIYIFKGEWKPYSDGFSRKAFLLSELQFGLVLVFNLS